MDSTVVVLMEGEAEVRAARAVASAASLERHGYKHFLLRI